MIRITTLAFALAVATSAQAMPVPKLDVPEGIVTHVAQACGVGFRRIRRMCTQSHCPTNPPRRAPDCSQMRKVERRHLHSVLLNT